MLFPNCRIARTGCIASRHSRQHPKHRYIINRAVFRGSDASRDRTIRHVMRGRLGLHGHNRDLRRSYGESIHFRRCRWERRKSPHVRRRRWARRKSPHVRRCRWERRKSRSGDARRFSWERRKSRSGDARRFSWERRKSRSGDPAGDARPARAAGSGSRLASLLQGPRSRGARRAHSMPTAFSFILSACTRTPITSAAVGFRKRGGST